MRATSQLPKRLKNEDLFADEAFLLMGVPECPYKKTNKNE